MKTPISKLPIVLALGVCLMEMPSAFAMKCKDVVFSVRNTTGSVIRITKVRYRDFSDSKVRQTDFRNRAIGPAGQTGQVAGLSIDLKNVRNERVGEFEFQYQLQTAPPNVFGASSWTSRRWSERQGDIASCNDDSAVSIRIPS